MRIVKRIAILLIVAGILGVIVNFTLLSKPLAKSTDVPAFKVKRGEFAQTLSTIGVLQAASSKVVSSPFNGKVVKIVLEGTLVKEGEPVLWMETTDLETQLKDLEADLQLAKMSQFQKEENFRLQKTKNSLALQAEESKVEFEKLKLKDAQIKYDTQKVLVERNLAARSTLDEARIAFLQAELTLKDAEISLKKLRQDQESDIKIKTAEIDSTRVEVERNQRRYDETKQKLADAIVKAPGQGNVAYLPIWKSGKMGKIAEGDQVWQRYNVLEIPDSSSMFAIVPVNEIDISMVKPGQQASVRIDAFPETEFKGAVESKGVVPISDSTRFPFSGGGTTSTAKEFEVKVKLQDIDPKLRQGMTASAKITIDASENVLYVPQEAVFKEEGDAKICFKKTGSGYEIVKVKTGLSNDNYTCIEEGLNEGDEVLLRDPRKNIEKIGLLEELKSRKAGVKVLGTKQ
jgi:HlyD family secretion protein